MRTIAAGVAVAVCSAAALVPSLLPARAAAGDAASHQALIDTTVRYLQESQQPDGGFAEAGREPNQDFSAWIALALAGAGINPQDQASCGVDAFTYLESHFAEGLTEEIAWPDLATTTFERELMVVDATGTDPHSFGGYDLVGEILTRQLPDGSFPYVPGGTAGESNDTIFAILALSPIHEAAVAEAIAAAREWVVGAEDEDGGWDFSGRAPSSEVDMTGAALEALAVAGPPAESEALTAYEEAIAGGLSYLRGAQLPDGGFPARPGEGESNVASTAWAVQGIWATGGDPEEWRYGESGAEPLDYMESMQQPDGHIRWKASADVNGIWMTSYVTPAFAGQALPIPPAARGAPATRGEAADCTDSGQGGEAPQPGTGVIAGGGGHRAPAFGRPRRASEGKTPGGARVVHGEGLRARDHSHVNRRGANVEQARGTESAEPHDPAEADQEVESVTPGEEASSKAGTASAAAAGGGDEGRGPGKHGAPLPVEGAPHDAAAASGEEVSGTVIGTPEGDARGKLAFGAPGLKSAGAGSGGGPGLAIGIGAAAALAALFGAGFEGRRRRIA